MTNPVTPLKLLAIAVASALSTVATGQDVPQIEEIAVIGQFVPDEKRGTSSVANVVGTEQFQRSGDSNIAEGLKRVSGLSRRQVRLCAGPRRALFNHPIERGDSTQPRANQSRCASGSIPDGNTG